MNMSDKSQEVTNGPVKNGWKGFGKSVAEKSLVGIVVAAVLALPFKQTVIYAFEKLGPQPQIPVGAIVAWRGVRQLPPGWEICNGLNGTPNLKDLFLKGVTDMVDAGQANKGTELYRGDYQAGDHGAGVFLPSEVGHTVVLKNYSVVYIMRLR